MKGKFIVIDGADGTGKATQAELLFKHLKKEKYLPRLIDFPQYYNNFFGKMVGEYLTGKFGKAIEVDPYLASLIYAGDRFESSDKIRRWLKDGKIVIANRYSASNSAHQGAKFSGKKQNKYLKWLDEMEFSVYKIPREDILIYLDVPSEFARKLILQKSKRQYTNKKMDQLEEDLDYQKKVADLYRKLTKKNINWHRIKCVTDNILLSPGEIHLKVWKIISKMI